MKQRELAAMLGCSQAMITHLETGRRCVSPLFARKIESITGGAVTRYDLRPDVFGDAPGAAA